VLREQDSLRSDHSNFGYVAHVVQGGISALISERCLLALPALVELAKTISPACAVLGKEGIPALADSCII
jgi:hypothetical protein